MAANQEAAQGPGGGAFSELRIRVHPGDGLVARFPSALLVVLGSAAAHRSVTDQLLDICSGTAAGGSPPGRRLTRQVAGVLAATEPEEVPPFCAISDAGAGSVAAILHGDVDLQVSGDRQDRLSGATASTWVDRILPVGSGHLVIGATGAAGPDLDVRLDLRAGVVSGGGATVIAAQVELDAGESQDSPGVSVPEPAAQPVPEPAAPPVLEPLETSVETPPPAEEMPVPRSTQAAGSDFESVLLIEPDPEPEVQREPLPQVGEKTTAAVAEIPDQDVVHGIICSRGHFNDPTTAYCSACGISMVQRTHNFVLGPRPPLGVIVLDDGATFAVSTNYVLGREPGEDDEVRSGRAMPLTITDEQATVSRVHADIELKDWDVVIRDRGSANGTYVAPAGTAVWTPLTPHVQVPLAPGSRVQIGRRVFVFDSHHKV